MECFVQRFVWARSDPLSFAFGEGRRRLPETAYALLSREGRNLIESEVRLGVSGMWAGARWERRCAGLFGRAAETSYYININHFTCTSSNRDPK